MKNILRKTAIFTMIGVLGSSLLLGCSGRSIEHDAIVSTVGDAQITLGFANFFARMQQPHQEMFQAMMGGEAGEMWDEVADPDTGETQEDMVKGMMMESIQQLFLLSLHAEEFGVSLSEQDNLLIEEAATEFINQNSPEALEAISGHFENVVLLLELYTIAERMTEAMGEGIDAEVSEEESLRKGMDVVFVPFMVSDDEGVVTHLTEEEIEELKSELQEILDEMDGDSDVDLTVFEEFAEVMPTTFGLEPDPGDPNLEFIIAMNELENVGDVTGLVEGAGGVFIGKLTSLHDEEATNEVIEQILEGRRSERIQSLLEEWRVATYISTNEELWAQVSFTELGVEVYQEPVEELDFE